MVKTIKQTPTSITVELVSCGWDKTGLVNPAALMFGQALKKEDSVNLPALVEEKRGTA